MDRQSDFIACDWVEPNQQIEPMSKTLAKFFIEMGDWLDGASNEYLSKNFGLCSNLRYRMTSLAAEQEMAALFHECGLDMKWPFGYILPGSNLYKESGKRYRWTKAMAALAKIQQTTGVSNEN